MAVNVKMGVDISGFTSGIKQGQQILKGLNAEMKASEAEFKATGNAEQKAASQTKTLNSQLNVQRGIADQAKQALQAMTDAGINPADAAYQKLYVQMLNAEAGANEALAALNALSGGTEKAAQGADKLSGSLQGISQKMSLQQVKEGIDKITSGLESAVGKAVELGEKLWNTILDSAKRADDIETMAMMYDIPVQKLKQMMALEASGLDTTVDAMLGAQDKLNKGIGSGSQEVMSELEQLGLAIKSGKDDTAHLITEDSVELFWQAGKALMAMDDAFDKEAAAQKLFGRNWKELKPLFDKYDSLEAYNAALDDVSVSSEDATKNAAELADRVAALEDTWTQLKDEVVGAVAPGLTKAADALQGLLARVLEYLKTDDGKKALQDLEKAVSGLFDDLGEIDPEKVVEGFTGVFNTVVSSVQWLSENWSSVVTAMEGIVAGWAALKLTGAALQIITLVQGITGMTAASAAAAGSAAGASWAAAFGTAAMEASPFLAFLYTLLNPAGTAKDDVDAMYDKNGNPTTAGREAGLTLTQEQQEAAWEYTKENQKRADRIRKRNEQLVMERNIEAQIEKEQAKSVEIDAKRVEEIRKRNERKTTFNPLISAGVGNNLLPDEAQYWLRGLYAPWTQINDKDFNMTDLLLPWKGIGKLWYKATGGGDQEKVEVPAELELPTDQAAGLVEQVGPVNIPVTLTPTGIGIGGGSGGKFGALDKWFGMNFHANGLWDVPYDGYLARLHKGERVMTAREVSSRNYSSNLYVESMYMNNGTDAAGLAAAMAAAQRRTMSGYGS